MLGALLRALAARPAACWHLLPLPQLARLGGRTVAAAAPQALDATLTCQPRTPAIVQRAAWRPICSSTSMRGSSSSTTTTMSSSSTTTTTVMSSSTGTNTTTTITSSSCSAASSTQQAPPRDPLVPPVEPGPSECCGRGCGDQCVWSIYFYERREHEAALAALTGEALPEDPFEAMERRLAQQAAAVQAAADVTGAA